MNVYIQGLIKEEGREDSSSFSPSFFLCGVCTQRDTETNLFVDVGAYSSKDSLTNNNNTDNSSNNFDGMRDKSVSRWLEKYRRKKDDKEEGETEEIEDLADATTPLIVSSSPSSHQRWENFKRRAPYYIPSSQWVPKYHNNIISHFSLFYKCVV